MNTANPTPFELVNKLPDNERDIVHSAFKDLLGQLERAEKLAKMSNHNALQTQANNQLLTGQIKMLASTLGPELADTYHCSEEQLLADMKSNDIGTILGTTERMICAANRHMMDLKANSRKRKGAFTHEPDQDTPSNSVDSSVPHDELSQQLAHTFGYNIQ